MIVDKEVDVKIGNLNFKYYKDLGYNFKKVGDIIKVNPIHLTKGSHSIINILCDYCGKELKVPYKRFFKTTSVVNKYACSDKDCSNQKIKDVCLIKYGVENPFQAEFVKEKSKETLKEKYGVEHPMYSESTKKKIRETCLEKYGEISYGKTKECKKKTIEKNLEKYGVEYPMLLPEQQLIRKNTRISKGLQIPDRFVSEYRKYRLSVNRLTYSLKDKILENWNGYDYYDGEFIRDNFNLNCHDRNYPHFDHKISVVYGFYNKINPKLIGEIDNICITKQWINGLKKGKCEKEFIKEFKKED